MFGTAGFHRKDHKGGTKSTDEFNAALRAAFILSPQGRNGMFGMSLPD